MDLETLLNKAENARASSRFSEAEKIFKTLASHASLDAADRAQALLGLADMERIQGYFTQSLQHYQKASKILAKDDPEAYWDAQVGWALAARACGRSKEALVVLQRALKAYRNQKDTHGIAFAHWALGGTFRIAGQMREGLVELLTALKIFKYLHNYEGIAYTCCALGGIFRMLGRYAESGKYYREANRRMRQRRDTFGIAYSYCGLGNVERMAGRFQKALPFYKKAEKLYGTIGDRVSYAYTLWSLGTTYKMLGHNPNALSAFQKADQLFIKTGDTRGRIYTLLGFTEVEWLKADDIGFPRPMRERARVRGNAFWKKAKSIADNSHYAWESLHVESLKGGRVNNLAKRYHKSGSLFYPKSLPANWP